MRGPRLPLVFFLPGWARLRRAVRAWSPAFSRSDSSPSPLRADGRGEVSSSPDSSTNPSIPSSSPTGLLYVGIDIARKDHLCVLDVGEKIGDVVWDRLRIELRNAPFDEIE